MLPGDVDASDNAVDGFLVVTGSSAGGIDALIRFVSNLSPDTAARIVVAQHLAPQHASALPEILSSRTSLPVETIEGEIELRAGTIYVVPPDRDIDIVDSKVASRVRLQKGPKPSIDRFFTTAANAYGDRLIAIILSGLGDDGARGARAVKAAGGTVIVQDPGSAGFSSMPLSIAPTLVDIMATPEDMGQILHNLVGTSVAPAASNEKKLLRNLLLELRERSGIDFSQYKTPTIMRRLSRLIVASGFDSLSEYAAHLHQHPQGYQRLVNSFLIKVTEFFRDTALFDMLRDHILPRMIHEAHEEERELRIWSAGTSTGEEAYSIAILCSEVLRNGPDGVTVRIFATDLDEEAISFARRGVYTADALREVPESLIERYFAKTEAGYEVCKHIRNMTVFGQHDLGQRAPFPRIDLVLCRNVLIYFTKELQSRALQLFAFALRNQGILVLGKAETTTPLPQYFRVYNSALKVYQREGERVLLPATRVRDSERSPMTFLTPATPSRETRIMANPSERQRPPAHEVIASYVAVSVVGVVVVDANYDIVAINSPARAMLQIHGVGVGSDIVHLVPSMGAKLRSLIDDAFSGEHGEPIVMRSNDPITGIDRWLQIVCFSQQTVGGGAKETAGLIIIDVTRYERRIQDDLVEREKLERAVQEQIHRAEELSSRYRAMLLANEELTSVNVELRTYNEQLLINAEEAASANEEIETLNEEMQATNEELETLNEELQATIEELNTTNDELESRRGELELRGAETRLRADEAKVVQEALEHMLGEHAPPYVLVNDAGELLSKSRNADDLMPAKADGAWWNGPAELRAGDGAVFEPARRQLSGGLALVTFRKKT